MNFLKAKLEKSGGKYFAQLYGVKVPLSDDKCALLAQHGAGRQDVILGIRPEHTQLCFDSAQSSIQGALRVNEMMGSELHLHAKLPDESNVILRIPTLDLTDEQRSALKYGAPVRFTFPEKVVQLFDPKTEKSLLY